MKPDLCQTLAGEDVAIAITGDEFHAAQDVHADSRGG